MKNATLFQSFYLSLAIHTQGAAHRNIDTYFLQDFGALHLTSFYLLFTANILQLCCFTLLMFSKLIFIALGKCDISITVGRNPREN